MKKMIIAVFALIAILLAGCSKQQTVETELAVTRIFHRKGACIHGT